jgi:MarR family transcriptional regulator, transcriptional regulator for hemolysin
MEVYVDPEIFRLPGHLIQRSSRLLLRLGEEKFHPLGLGIAQMPVLYALKDGASLTQTELAKMARIEQPTMAQLLTRMERDGLIRRTANPHDKRSSLISLTPLALKKLPLAKAALLQGSVEALQGFTEREIATLSRLLRRVVKNLDPTAPGIEFD